MDWFHVQVILVFRDGNGDKEESRKKNVNEDPWIIQYKSIGNIQHSEKSIFQILRKENIVKFLIYLWKKI